MPSKKVNVRLPNPGSLNIELHLTGDWEKAVKVVDGISPSIQKGYDKAIEQFSTKLLRIIKTAVLTGKPPKGAYWQPLSDATIRRWGEHPIYNLTGLFGRSIGLYSYKNKTYVGIQANKRRSSQDGLTLNQLAILLEHGSRNNSEGTNYIPPRPLWAPALNEMGGIQALRKLIIQKIRSQLRTDLGINPNRVR